MNHFIILHLHNRFDIGIIAVTDVLLLDLNDGLEALTDTGTMKELDRL